MRASLRKRPFLLLILAVIILVVAFLGREFVRDFVARPFLYSLWQAWHMSKGFPEVLVWALFVAVIPVIAIFNLLVSGKIEEPEPIEVPPPQQGQVQANMRLLQQAPQGDYFKTRLFRHLSRMTLDCLGYRERLSEKQVRALLKIGDIELDPAILKAIKQGWRQRVDSSPSGRGQQTGDWQDPQVEKILQFLENELDMKEA
jgi:hypothetical protein